MDYNYSDHLNRGGESYVYADLVAIEVSGQYLELALNFVHDEEMVEFIEQHDRAGRELQSVRCFPVVCVN